MFCSLVLGPGQTFKCNTEICNVSFENVINFSYLGRAVRNENELHLTVTMNNIKNV